MANRRNNNSPFAPYTARAARSRNMLPAQAAQQPGQNMVWTNEAVESSDFLVFRDAITDKIKNVIAPNGLQIGLYDNNFVADLNITGQLTGSGKAFFNDSVSARLGFTGSLQKLTDGSNYLVQGSNVTITNNPNGSISIAANASANLAEPLTVGTGLSFTGGSNTFDGSVGRTVAVDINGVSTVDAIATDDTALIYDTSTSSVKKVTVANLRGSLSSFDIHNLPNELVLPADQVGEHAPTNADQLAIADNDENNVSKTKRISLDTLARFFAGNNGAGQAGVHAVGGNIKLAFDSLSSSTLDPANDEIVFIDSGEPALSRSKRESVADFVQAIRGTSSATGLTSTAGVLSVDIDSLPAGDPGDVAGGTIMLYDSDSDSLKKAGISAFSGAPTNAEYVVLSANGSLTAETVLSASDGIALSGATLSLNMKSNAGIAVDDSDGKFFIEPHDFAGTGLEDDGSNNLRIATTAAGTGLSGGGGAALSVDYGTTATTAVRGDKTAEINAGYGLTGGLNPTALGLGFNTTIDVAPEEFAGTGTSVSSNNINTYLSSSANISITTGSEGQLGVGLNSVVVLDKIISKNVFSNQLTGSLTRLTNGNAFIQAGDNITISTGSNGEILIAATAGGDVGTITAVSPGTGLLGGGSSGDVTLSVNNSVVATLTGSVFSGTVSSPAFSGSLTKLSNGQDYLVAGAGITISTGSSGAITVSSSGAGVIGEPEDGTYNDGVFTDFTTSTRTGIAVDRFNELLKALAPSPAPDLDNLDCENPAGATGLLSFGAANDQSSATPAYASSNTAAGFSAVNVNGSFAPATSGANIRKGIFNGTAVISGTLNQDVTQDAHNSGVVNFVADSFGNADVGTLQLHVNGSQLHSVDLTQASAGAGVPGSGTANQLNSNGSGFFNLSQTGSAVQSTNVKFPAFKHRTGKYKIAAADQRNGWNYAQVIHAKPSGNVVTNYIEWVNDPNSHALQISGTSIGLTGLGSIHLSGVEYFQSASVQYKSRVTNAYKYVFDDNAIQFPASRTSFSENAGVVFNIPNQSKPTINTGAGENHTKVLHLTSSATYNSAYFLNGTFTVGTTVTHPLKADLTNAGQQTTGPTLIYNLNNNSTALVETFQRENFRIISGSYDTQASIVLEANEWDSTAHMTSSNGGHTNGLQFFDQKLLAPKNTVNSGNFSNFSAGPALNPNYSGVSGTRTFLRWFKNETGSTQYDFSMVLSGSGTIVTEGTALSGNNISVLIRKPPATGWLDLAKPVVLDSLGDTAGAHVDNAVLDFDNSLNPNATNYVSFGNVGIGDNEYILVKIIADANWNGNIDRITTAFGAGTGTLTAVPDLDDIDIDQDGTDANLSFGAAKSISGYENSATAAGFSAANLNDLYQTADDSNNLRASIFNGATTIEGDLNADVSSPGNDFAARTFSDANSGSLKLEVNGVLIHTLEITGSQTLIGSAAPGSGNGTSLNSDGSGFTNISRWEPGLFDNGVPRYSEIQRTAKYKIAPASQRNGWNYARVIHAVGGANRATNYVEWINDSNSEALSGSDSLTVFGDNSFAFLSGVKYFTSPSGSLNSEIHNVYKNVYSDSNNAISFTSLNNATANKIVQNGAGISATKTTNAAAASLQTLATSANSQNQMLQVSGTINFTRSKSLPGTYTTAFSCGGAMVFDHPLKSNLTTTTQTKTNLLVWTPSDSSNANTSEVFTGEQYRLVSGSYTAQNAVSGGANNWNSQRSMNDQGNFPEHATGLLVYDEYLIPPKDGGSSGDFRNHTEGGAIESPLGNVNYSSGVLTNATRDYFRSFLNNTTNDRPSVQITLVGDATIVGRSGTNAGTLGANKNIFVEVGIPGKTGLMDLGRPSAGSGNFDELDGCLSGDLDSTVDGAGATNTATFNGRTVDGTVSGAEYIVIRISASKNWTGKLESITVGWS